MTDQELKLSAHLSDEKLRAEVSKLIAETTQIRLNIFLAPFLAAAGLIGATAAAVKLFF